MGRPGGGHRSGGRSSSGHRSSSRRSGGHRVGGGRPGRSFSSSRGFSSGGMRPGGFRFGGGYHHTTVYTGDVVTGGRFPGALVGFFIVVILLFVASMVLPSTSVPASTQDREPISVNASYDNNCVVDQVGWFSNVPRVERELQSFYDETGVQPYVVMVSYHPELTTDADKDAYAQQWYDDNIDNEGTFLYMYFAEEDADNDLGYSVYVNGSQVNTVMDAEAVDIFWAYLDQYWFSDLSMDDVIVKTFDSTADRIMTQSISMETVVLIIFGGVIVIVLVGLGVYALRMKFARDKEKAAETERILNTPLNGADDDPLLDKYEKGDDTK